MFWVPQMYELIQSSSQSWEVDTLISPSLQIGKPRLQITQLSGGTGIQTQAVHLSVLTTHCIPFSTHNAVKNKLLLGLFFKWQHMKSNYWAYKKCTIICLNICLLYSLLFRSTQSHARITIYDIEGCAFWEPSSCQDQYSFLPNSPSLQALATCLASEPEWL